MKGRTECKRHEKFSAEMLKTSSALPSKRHRAKQRDKPGEMGKGNKMF